MKKYAKTKSDIRDKIIMNKFTLTNGFNLI